MTIWIDLLRASPSFAARLLPPLASVTLDAAIDDDLPGFLSALEQQDRALVIGGLDLLAGEYLPFLRSRLPQMLASLRSARSDELAAVGPVLRGQPVWGRTVVGWASGALATDRVVSRLPIRTMDLPENVALRLLLERLAVSAGIIAKRLGNRTHPVILEVSSRAGLALRDPGVMAISRTGGPSEQMLRAAEGASDPSYRKAGRLLRRHLALSQVDDLGRWRQSAFAASLGPAGLVPVEPDEVFELLGLARVLDVLEHNLALGPPRSFWMRIGTHAQSGPVAEFVVGKGDFVEIYFDRSPSFFLEAPGPYAEVFRRHEGLGRGAGRRPDIVIVRHRPGQARGTFFLEAKLPSSEEVGSYIRDSVYKAFGYLYDFRSLWENEQAPKVGLFIPADAGLRTEETEQPSDLVVLSPHRPGDMVQSIKAALGL